MGCFHNLAIVIEDPLTTTEKNLLEKNELHLFKSLNLTINNIIKSKLKILIEQKLAVKVSNILFDFSLRDPCTGVIVILSQPPVVRSRKTIIPKSQRENEYLERGNSTQVDKNLNLVVIMLYLLFLEPDRDMQPDIYLWKIASNLDKRTIS